MDKRSPIPAAASRGGLDARMSRSITTASGIRTPMLVLRCIILITATGEQMASLEAAVGNRTTGTLQRVPTTLDTSRAFPSANAEDVVGGILQAPSVEAG